MLGGLRGAVTVAVAEKVVVAAVVYEIVAAVAAAAEAAVVVIVALVAIVGPPRITPVTPGTLILHILWQQKIPSSSAQPVILRCCTSADNPKY